MANSIRIGFLVNPIAGVGGPTANKGSDALELQKQAREGLIALRAPLRAKQFLTALTVLMEGGALPEFITCPGDMGQDYFTELGFTCQCSTIALAEQTSAQDTLNQLAFLLDQKIDFLLFVGGDGTARDICSLIGNRVPVLGIPSGVKMHSGVFAIAPEPAAELVAKLLNGELTALQEQEVRDIDELAFNEGRVRSRHYGEMLVPAGNQFVQHVKQGGMEVEELVLLDMAAELRERLDMLDESVTLVFGPGSTTQIIQRELGLDATLLGIDLAVFNPGSGFELLTSDISASELEAALETRTGAVRLVITAIGGQGHIIGRGNQQLSPTVLQYIGKDNTWVVATKRKLENLNKRPLLVDSNDPQLDFTWAGFIPVICGYQDVILYPVGWQMNEGGSDGIVELDKRVEQVVERCREVLAADQSLNSRRLFHGRGGLWSGLEWCCVDYFYPCILVTFFKEPEIGFEAKLVSALRSHFISIESLNTVLVQYRYLLGAPIECQCGQIPEPWLATRNELTFLLSSSQQNVGFFLDIEPARNWLESIAYGKHILNLFAYTCAFSVVAEAAGAESIVNIDMSGRSLSVGRDNHRINGLPLRQVKFLPHNIFKSWGKLKKEGPYDVVIVDPPSYQKGSFIAQKDYPKVLRKMADLVGEGGVFIACLNAPEISAEAFEQIIEGACPEFELDERLYVGEQFADIAPARALKMFIFRKLGDVEA